MRDPGGDAAGVRLIKVIGSLPMVAGLQPICPSETPCKCCGAPASLYGLLDFNKNCEIYRNNALEISGVPIYYHRCRECRFIFTTALDHFSKADFERYVYNDQYLLIDPDFLEAHPRHNAKLVIQLLSQAKAARILDYGGGNGTLARLLVEAGFSEVESYDPFVPRFAEKPDGRFDCVICFEVLEHSTDPSRTLLDITEMLTDTGIILLSTLLQPGDIDSQGLGWWYAAPRNAHVSLYSPASLEKLARSAGFQLHSLDQSYHVLYRNNATLLPQTA
jgi:2-polyprenyl-6-hydroxyphenyl methylase/3-demethylubiquinone-9 3-methyltransferase